MSLSFIDWETNGVTILNLSGRLTLGEGTRLFRQLMQDALSLGKVRLVLNMSEIYHIDSTGLGELVSANTSFRSNGGALKLMKLSGRAQALLGMTRLYTIFEIYPDEESAVQSFFRG